MISIPIFTLAIFSSVAQATTYPFQPTPVPDYPTAEKSSADVTRLRLSVSIDSSIKDDSLKIGDLIFCSSTACFRPTPKTYISAKSTEFGTATTVFDSAVPYGDIRTIFFGEVAGQKIISGRIELPSTLSLEKGFQGADILVLLKKSMSRNNVVYVPARATSALMDNTAQAVYYDPSFSSTVSLPYGVTLKIPEGSTDGPQIFSVAVRDVGNYRPSVDIYPYINTKKEFTVTSATAFKARSTLVPPQTPPLVPDAAQKSILESTNTPLTRKFNKTGNLNFSQVKDDASAKPSIEALATGMATPCSVTIANPTNQNTITNMLQINGTLNVNWCEQSEPYIHIGVIELSKPPVTYGLAYSQKYPEVMNLKPIVDSDFLNKSTMTVNGFYWAGDEGTADGQTGRPSGYVKYNNNQIGVNYTSGVSQGNKRVLTFTGGTLSAQWTDNAAINNYYTNDFVISSSTSIVRDGVCTTDGLRNRWSALGETNGRIVLISSTSGGETSAASLCEVFKSLNIRNAIRLDGGPSTAMTFGPTLVNPLTGLARLKYGNMRRIAYSIKMWFNR
jgi:hypothetical protein